MLTFTLILFLIACGGFIFSIIQIIRNAIKKQDNKNNKKILIGCVVLAIVAIALPTGSSSKEDTTKTVVTQNQEENKKVEEENSKEKDIKVEEPKAKEENENKQEEEKTMPRENLVGKSNKDFKDLSKSTPREVRNDVTGNLRLETISKSCKIEEYALSYYKENFNSDEEVHAIINFSTNTTTRISNMGNFIEVIVLEYAPKEEHDAKKLFGGMKLGHYWVYKDNGDIEKIE